MQNRTSDFRRGVPENRAATLGSSELGRSADQRLLVVVDAFAARDGGVDVLPAVSGWDAYAVLVQARIEPGLAIEDRARDDVRRGHGHEPQNGR
jgi:hypothetical protein